MGTRKAADSEDPLELLSGEGITPPIHMRSLWQTEPERMLSGHDGSSNVVYKEDGTIYCYGRVSQPAVRHQITYIGQESERETLKYRCPAKHDGWDCPMSNICNAGKSYGKRVRVDRQLEPRRFPSLPRATKNFEWMYKGRTAVERVNARLKVLCGVDDGHLTGTRRFVAQVGVVLALHAAFATLLVGVSAPAVATTVRAETLRDRVDARKSRIWSGPTRET
jgi:hypothetical protein